MTNVGFSPRLLGMIAFYPGSFDPATKGHADIVQRALNFCPKLIVGVGQHSEKNYLFSKEERLAMLQSTLSECLALEDLARVTITDFQDTAVDAAVRFNATLIVKGVRNTADYQQEEAMAQTNQGLNPNIETVTLFTRNALRYVSSSAVKEMAAFNVAPDKFDLYLIDSVRDALVARKKNSLKR